NFFLSSRCQFRLHRVAALGFTPSCLGQPRGRLNLVFGRSPSLPQVLCNPLRQWCDRTCPHLCCVTQANREWGHQPAVTVPLLEEPCPTQRLFKNPVEHIRIDVGANGFHQIVGQTVASRGVEV